MTDLEKYKGKRVNPPNRRFETRVNQKPRTDIFRVYISSSHRAPRVTGRKLQIGKVFTAGVQIEETTDRLFWSPVFYDPWPGKKNQKTFEAFGRTWKVYKSNPVANMVPVWVFTSDFTGDLPEAKPGSTTPLPIPDDLFRVILES